jgi:hypothetical protein
MVVQTIQGISPEASGDDLRQEADAHLQMEVEANIDQA